MNVGWVDGDCAYLLSDTAQTRPGRSESELTSLGQRQQRDDNQAVEESVAKLVPLGSHSIAALCGDGMSALDFVRDLRRRITLGAALEESIEASAANIRHHVPQPRPFQVTIASWGDGRARLLQFRSKRGDLIDLTSQQIVLAGSLRDRLSSIVRERILGVPRGLKAKFCLTAALAFLHNLASSEDLVSNHVGGAMYGAWVDRDGVHWQSSICYFYYQNDPPNVGLHSFEGVSVRVLDSVCVVGSSITQDVRAFAYSDGNFDSAEWQSKWRAELGPASAMDSAEFFTFIRAMGESIAVVARDQGQVHYRVDDGVGLQLSPLLEDRLRWRPTPDQERNFTLWFEA